MIHFVETCFHYYVPTSSYVVFCCAWKEDITWDFKNLGGEGGAGQFVNHLGGKTEIMWPGAGLDVGSVNESATF